MGWMLGVGLERIVLGAVGLVEEEALLQGRQPACIIAFQTRPLTKVVCHVESPDIDTRILCINKPHYPSPKRSNRQIQCTEEESCLEVRYQEFYVPLPELTAMTFDGSKSLWQKTKGDGLTLPSVNIHSAHASK